MKIRVAFIDNDDNYLQRVKAKLRRDYPDDIEAGYYSNIDIFVQNFKNNKVDVAVVNSSMLGDALFSQIPCPVLLISEDNSEGTIGEYQVIGKYQKFEEVYRNIISIYSDTVKGVGGFVPTSATGKRIFVFASPAGGCGSSTLAVACSERLAKLGKRVMYVNLERIAYYYYTGNNGGFEDLLYTLKENKSNLPLKIESMARKSTNGVLVLPAVKNALDLGSLEDEDIEALISAVYRIESVDYLVVDADFSLSDRTYQMFDKATDIVITSDGTEIANHKLKMMFECFNALNGKYDFAEKIRIIYNRFSAGSFCSRLDATYRDLGEIPRYKATEQQIIEAVSELSNFDILV
ncbi:MAG: hypothetical protein K6G24_03065 [Lachnospiraceae bacterium]|nr:hypothetical protein [Lachnospiraceae bacterium]